MWGAVIRINYKTEKVTRENMIRKISLLKRYYLITTINPCHVIRICPYYVIKIPRYIFTASMVDRFRISTFSFSRIIFYKNTNMERTNIPFLVTPAKHIFKRITCFF